MTNNKKQPFPINYLYSVILALVFSYFSAGISVVKAEDKLTLKYTNLHRDPVNDSVIFLRDVNLSDALEPNRGFPKACTVWPAGGDCFGFLTGLMPHFSN